MPGCGGGVKAGRAARKREDTTRRAAHDVRPVGGRGVARPPRPPPFAQPPQQGVTVLLPAPGHCQGGWRERRPLAARRVAPPLSSPPFWALASFPKSTSASRLHQQHKQQQENQLAAWCTWRTPPPPSRWHPARLASRAPSPPRPPSPPSLAAGPRPPAPAAPRSLCRVGAPPPPRRRPPCTRWPLAPLPPVPQGGQGGRAAPDGQPHLKRAWLWQQRL